MRLRYAAACTVVLALGCGGSETIAPDTGTSTDVTSTDPTTSAGQTQVTFDVSGMK